MQCELHFAMSFTSMKGVCTSILEGFGKDHGIRQATLMDVQAFLRSRSSRDDALSTEDVPTVERGCPGPKAFLGSKTKGILCPGSSPQVVNLPSTCSDLKASVLLLGVYYILNLSYPSSYGQLLGFLQTFIVKRGSRFDRGYQSARLCSLISACKQYLK
ncbi:uncharacterized protein LOC121048226 [Ixodes scapularis]|uniref:uncharacterized protein LOC121837052 n=1 Tax=Ixodes scapularis TaxID=6945 RepID=UPI001C38627F|nr:uncharacterized protein LOC121837052 [Ixodes scapularis]XP_042148920.1 uncharacterized protein LOC121048226 [Ixodes scapularis]